MRRAWIIVAVLGHSAAIARAGDAIVRSPTSPGTLGFGNVGGQFGAAAGTGAFGLGGRAVIGLGDADILASVSFLPGLLGSAADVFVGAGVQVKLATSADGRTLLGARATVEVQTTGWNAWHMSTFGLVASTGSSEWRGVGEALVVSYHQDGFPEDEGRYLGGAVGVERLGGSLGYRFLIGTGAPLDGQSRWIPLASIEGTLR